MEWNRAKGILIILFAVLNIVLAVCIVGEISGDRISAEVIEATVNALEDSNIEIKCEIPDKVMRNMVLSFNQEYELPPIEADSVFAGVEYTGANSAEWSGLYTANEVGAEQQEAFRAAAAEKIIETFGLSWAEMKKADTVISDDGSRIRDIYYGRFQDYITADTYIAAEFTEAGMEHFEVHAYEPDRINRREQGTAAINAILLKYYTGEGPDTVNSINAAFMNYIEDAAVPESGSVPFIWIIDTDKGMRYFRGADGVEIFR